MATKRKLNYNLQSRIKAAMRNVARYDPQVSACLNNSVHPTVTGPRGGKMFKCAKCGEGFARKDIQVDHLEPVVPVHLRTKDLDWNTIVARMFCGPDNLQVLCKPCHLEKSNAERKLRKQFRDDIE